MPWLKQGKLIAHHTSTIAGVAANPLSKSGLRKLQIFKQRKRPFIMLAASRRIAARWIRYYPKGLRQLMRQSWPGNVTLIVPAKPGLPIHCYQRGYLALRLDPSIACLRHTRHGLLCSSSLNRKKQAVQTPETMPKMRWQRFSIMPVHGSAGYGIASQIFHCSHRGIQRLR